LPHRPARSSLIRERRLDDPTVEIARRLFLGNKAPMKPAKEFALIDKRIDAIRAALTKQFQ